MIIMYSTFVLEWLLLFIPLLAVTGAEHSLVYRYTIQSKHSESNIYDCTAVTLLDDRQIDFYNSTDESRTPTQDWLKNISEPDQKTITEKLKYDGQWLNKIIVTHMKELGHSESDGHVLQWRHGCEGELRSDGSLTFFKNISEFGYDGNDLIHFNCTSGTWSTSTKFQWITHFHYIAVRKCAQCGEMLKIYLQYNSTDITPSQSPPAVQVFAKQSVRDRSKLNLTCLATGFYPEDVKMSMRKDGTSIPEHLLTSSGVRPNDDGTYQLRMSIEIQRDDPADYHCVVNHSSLRSLEIKKWDGECINCTNERSRSVTLGVVLLFGLIVCGGCVLCVLRRKKLKSIHLYHNTRCTM